MTTNERMGVLTFHQCINYGTYWQARSLLEGLARWNPILLDYRSERVERKELECAVSPTLPVRSTARDRVLYQAKIRQFERAIHGLPRSSAFELDETGDMPDFDTVIVGSDEVWNL